MHVVRAVFVTCREYVILLDRLQDEKPLAEIPAAVETSLEAQALAACTDLEKKLSSNSVDLIEAYIGLVLHVRFLVCFLV